MLTHMKEHHHDEGPHLALADALALLRLGKRKQAISSLQELLTTAELPEVRFLLAKVLIEQKDEAAAISHLEIACNSQKPFFDAHLLLAQHQEDKLAASAQLLALRDLLALLKEQIELFSLQLPEDGRNLAEVFMGHINKELQTMPSLHQKCGELLLGLEKPKEAYEQLLRAFVCTPNAGDLRYRLGLSAASAANYKLAYALLAETEKAQTVAPEIKKKASETIASIDQQKDEGQDELLTLTSKSSTTELKKVKGLEKSSHYHYLLGLARLKEKKRQEAISAFEQASLLDDEFINPALLLVGLHQQGKDKKASFAPFLKAAQGAYKSLKKLYAALAEMVAKDPIGALPLLGETLALVSHLDDLHDTTGYLLMKAEESDRAFPHFLRALCKNPLSTRAHLGLARASAYSWHHHLAAHLSLQTLQEDSFNTLNAHLHGLTTLSHLPGDKEAFALCGKLQDKAKHPDVRFLARKVYHQWRDHFEKQEEGQKDESPKIDLEESKKIMRSGETQDKLVVSFQILKTKDQRALPMLLSSIESEKDPFVLSAYAKALGAIGDGSDVVWSTLQGLMKHEDSRVRANTIEALDKVEDDLVWPILVPMLQDPDNRVKANTIRSLLKRNVEGAQDLVAKLAYSSKQSRRESALFCMSRANAPWCSPILQNMLDKESIDELVQEECRQLALVGQKESIGLLAALADQAPAVRQEPLETTLSTLCQRYSISDDECEELKLAHLANVRPQAAEAVADLSVSRWEVEVEPQAQEQEAKPLLPLLLAAAGVLVVLVVLVAAFKRTPQPKIVNKPLTVQRSNTLDTVARVIAVQKDKGRIVVAEGNRYYVLKCAKEKIPSLKRGETIRVAGKLTGKKVGVSTEVECSYISQLKEPKSAKQP